MADLVQGCGIMSGMTPGNETELVRQAKQGDPAAIATLINRSLQSQEITVQARREGDRLDLTLQAPRPLSQERVSALIQRGLTQLRIAAIRTVRLYAYQVGEPDALWQQEVDLAVPPTVIPQTTTVSQSASVGSQPTAVAFATAPQPTATQAAPIVFPILVGDWVVQATQEGTKVDPVVQNYTIERRSRPTPSASFGGALTLIGRQGEIQTATATLRSASVMEFYGEPGVGKTVLLRSLAVHPPLMDLFTDGQVYHSVAGQPVSDILQQLFDDFFELQSDIAIKPTEVQIQTALRDKRALILLDDLELGEEGIERLVHILPNLGFLLGSGARQISGYGESFALAGLALRDSLALVERGLGRSLTDDERNPAEAMCHILGGNPLRILQAIALVREGDAPFMTVVEHLQTASPDLVILQSVVAQPDHPNMRSLAVLGVLGGIPVALHHLAALTGSTAIQAELAPLIQQGIVQTDGSHYSLASNLVQPLQEAGDLAQWVQHTITYFTRWADNQVPEVLAQDARVLQQVVDLGLATDQWPLVQPLAYRLANTFFLTKQWGAWEQICQRSLRGAQSTNDRATEAWAWHELGTRAFCLSDVGPAEALLSQALTIRESIGDEAGASLTRHNLGLLRQPAQTPLPTPVAVPSVTQEVQSNSAGSPSWLPILGIFLLFLGIGSLVSFLIYQWFFRPDGPPSFALSEESLDFGRVRLNTTSPEQIVTLQNTGSRPLVVDRLVLTGNHIDDFQLMEECTDAPLPPQEECELAFSFTPQEQGVRQASVLFIDRQGNSQPILALNGTGIESEGSVRLQFEPGRLNFEAQLVGTRSPARTVTLTNTGSVPITLRSISPLGDQAGDFASTTTCLETALAPGATCNVQVSFQPTAAEMRNATLAIAGTADDNPNQPDAPRDRLWNVPLTGTGIGDTSPDNGGNDSGVDDGSTPDGNPDNGGTPDNGGSPDDGSGQQPAVSVAQLIPNNLTFGNQPVDTAGPGETITVINSGTAPLRISRVYLVGEQIQDFSILAVNCRDVLAAGDRCTVQVRFNPIAQGERLASLVVDHNAPNSPRSILLRGIGAPPPVAPLPRILQFRASPEAVTAGEQTRLCYGVANATFAYIDGVGQVAVSNDSCVIVTPEQTTTYTLFARNSENRQVNQSVTVTVRPVDQTPPPIPSGLTPGSLDPQQPFNLFPCVNATLSWAPVSDPNGPVDYLVTLEYQELGQNAVPYQGGSWLPYFRDLAVSDPQFTIEEQLSSGFLYRWTVRSRDNTGTLSRNADSRYFTCILR